MVPLIIDGYEGAAVPNQYAWVAVPREGHATTVATLRLMHGVWAKCASLLFGTIAQRGGHLPHRAEKLLEAMASLVSLERARSIWIVRGFVLLQPKLMPKIDILKLPKKVYNT